VNNIPDPWISGVPRSGIPKHPVRKIFNDPPVYEFGSPYERSTYPRYHDAGYWFSGAHPYFDLKQQLKAIFVNSKLYFQIFFYLVPELVVSFLLLSFMSNRKWFYFKDLSKYLSLIVPSTVAMVLYLLVHLEERYIAAFFLIFSLSTLLTFCLPDSIESRKLFKSITIVVLIMFTIKLSALTGQNVINIFHNVIKGRDANVTWNIASGLNQAGIKAGDKVATIVDDYNQYWARLAKVTIVAEIPSEYDINNFWTAHDVIKSKVISAFAKTGAKVIVTENIPSYAIDYALKSGWKRVGSYNYYIYFLK
jgi:hypothetical protein